MSKEMVISANPHETRVAILEEGQLCEFYVEREKEFALVGSIYKGRVTRVLPGMQSAFVDIGLDSDAFLYVSDFLEDIEEFDHIVTTVEDKLQKLEDQGGQVFPASGVATPALEPADVEAGAPLAGEAQASEQPFIADAPAPPVYRPAAPPSQPPASSAPGYDRGRSDHRRFEGRSEGRREGRYGRRGGRAGGGRPGRGGGRSGAPRYGRELPQSKYAPSRPYDGPPGEPGAPEGHVSIILPGESLAKYKERDPAAAPLVASPVAPAEDFAPAAPVSAPVEPTPQTFTPQPFTPQPYAPSRAEFHPSSSTGLEPLPGESLSKYKSREHSAEEHIEPAAPLAPRREEPEPHHARDVFDAHMEHRAGTPQEAESTHGPEPAHAAELPHAELQHVDHSVPDLSEDEAAALAEHVAEAQVEEATRNAQQRDFAAQEDSHNAGLSESEEESTGQAEEDDAEEEYEEAQAETEGMIAHPDALEHSEVAEGTHAEGGSSDSLDEQMPGNQAPPEQQPWKAQVRSDFRSRMQHPARRGGRDRGDRGGRRDDRGRRPQHGHSGGGQSHHRPQPRRTQLIADMLKQGEEIIIQIAKEPLGKKGARITSHVALPGRYLVYMPTLDHTGVSRKIASAEDRSRLRHLVSEAKGTGGGGFIVRTAAASATPEEVRADVEFLMRTWSEIKTRSEQRKAPSLLHRDLNLVERILRDYMTPDYSAIWVDTEEEYTKVVDFMSRFQPQLVNRVKLYTKDTPVFEEFGIQQEIDKGLRPKVWLKSGGYIVINHTEALVAIDVNTGKFVGKGSNRLEDTIVRTNVEAVKEIVRQMRLRDLGGIIVIDFIDMEERRNREKVMAALEDALRADRAPSKVLRFNEFGLVAITRKRTKQALERTLCQPCPYCTGSGMVKSIPTLAYEIQCEARKMAPEVSSGSLTLRVHPEISKALKTRESGLIEELERWTKKSVIIQADPTLHWEQYDIY
jgi:Rne/Rng family ribonuclease